MPKRVLDMARSHLGIKQWSASHKALVVAYNRVKPLPAGYRVTYADHWCDVFVTVMFDKCGLSNLIGRECGVQRHINIFKNKGIWLGVARPNAGDIITFDWNGDWHSDHIGIVERVAGNTVHTIEGNTSRMVARRSYAWNDRRILGYARPKYGPPPIKKPPASTADTVVQEVISGKWGNGADRINRLTKAGYNANQVQQAVNQALKKKTNQEIAKEVWQGKWGNGADRVKRLTDAGYDAGVIQKLVNAM